MAFPLLPLLAVAAVAAIAAASKGDGDDGQGDGTGLPGPEPQQAQVIPFVNLETAVPQWKASGYQAHVAELSISLSNVHDITVLAANKVFPGLPMPPSRSTPPSNGELWRIMRNDVWDVLNPGVPYPID